MSCRKKTDRLTDTDKLAKKPNPPPDRCRQQ